jgi:hypothetical protein
MDVSGGNEEKRNANFFFLFLYPKFSNGYHHHNYINKFCWGKAPSFPKPRHQTVNSKSILNRT